MRTTTAFEEIGELMESPRARPEDYPARAEDADPRSPLGQLSAANKAADPAVWEAQHPNPDLENLITQVAEAEDAIAAVARAGWRATLEQVQEELVAVRWLEVARSHYDRLVQGRQQQMATLLGVRQEWQSARREYQEVRAWLIAEYPRARKAEQYGARPVEAWAGYDERYRRLESLAGPAVWYQSVAPGESS